MVTLLFSKQLLDQLIECASNAQKLKNIYAYKLAMALIWYGEGHGIQEIAKRLRVNTKTVFSWLKKFMSGGIKWLKRQHFHAADAKKN